MKILHVVSGLEDKGNGIAIAAKLIAGEQKADLVEARLFACGKCNLSQYDEVWVHSAWLLAVLVSCFRVICSGRRLVRMSHANYDPVRLTYHGWKKRLVGPIERFCLRRCAMIVATCEAEKGWIEAYLGRRCPPVEVTDIKRFFKLPNSDEGNLPSDRPLHLLYLGRRHPLKGLESLGAALRELQDKDISVNFRVVSSAFGEELKKAWDWCDVLVLPTLSENFGLVIAEALERGKRVITTDGAPAWGVGLTGLTGFSGLYSGYEGRLVYLKGYRDGTPQERVRLLKSAIASLVSGLMSK